MLQELLLMINDLKTTCEDRLDSVTANGRELKDLFDDIEELINDELNKKQKSK